MPASAIRGLSVLSRGVQFWLLPVVLIALLAAACSSESISAQVATPAQEAEAVSTTTTTIAATTTIVATTTTVASEVGGHDHGPDGHDHGSGAGFVEYNATKTDTHQHSATENENVVKHEHAYVTGPDSHWHEGEKMT